MSGISLVKGKILKITLLGAMSACMSTSRNCSANVDVVSSFTFDRIRVVGGDYTSKWNSTSFGYDNSTWTYYHYMLSNCEMPTSKTLLLMRRSFMFFHLSMNYPTSMPACEWIFRYVQAVLRPRYQPECLIGNWEKNLSSLKLMCSTVSATYVW